MSPPLSFDLITFLTLLTSSSSSSSSSKSSSSLSLLRWWYWLLLMFKVISIWNYRNWRERGGERESSRKHIELIMMLVSPMSHALIPFKKQTKYDVINENKIKICWNQLDFISANSALISHLDYLQELRWRVLSLTLRYFYLRLGKTGNKKPATSFATLLYNELNSDVAWFITHEKNLPPYRFERG